MGSPRVQIDGDPARNDHEGGRRGVLAWAVLLVAIVPGVLVPLGCRGATEDTEPGPELQSLRAEPLARLKLPGGELVLDTELEDDVALGKPISAQVLRVFSYDHLLPARAGRTAAIEAARESGWELGPARGPREALFGAKALPTGDATLVIHEYREDAAFKVSIKLEHTQCPAVQCGSA
jgi:hypothetical protein